VHKYLLPATQTGVKIPATQTGDVGEIYANIRLLLPQRRPGPERAAPPKAVFEKLAWRAL